jgi:hypothetical protein
LLRKDLRTLTLRQPVLVVFDTYEDAADNKTVVNWLNQFLTEVETALGLIVIVAGQSLPDYRKASWGDLVLHLPLNHITEIAHWEPWTRQRYPNFEMSSHLHTLLLVSDGRPSLMVAAFESIFQKASLADGSHPRSP